MTLDDLECQNRGFYVFLAAATQNHSQGGATVLDIILYYMHFSMTVIMVFYFISNSHTYFHCTISLYCECNNLLFGTFLLHSIWWNGLHRPVLQRNLWYFVWWCCHLGSRFTTPSLVLGVVKHLFLQSGPSVHNADRLHWLSCYISTLESSYCFPRVLAIAILSICLSVCFSVCPDRHTGGTR